MGIEQGGYKNAKLIGVIHTDSLYRYHPFVVCVLMSVKRIVIFPFLLNSATVHVSEICVSKYIHFLLFANHRRKLFNFVFSFRLWSWGFGVFYCAIVKCMWKKLIPVRLFRFASQLLPMSSLLSYCLMIWFTLWRHWKLVFWLVVSFRVIAYTCRRLITWFLVSIVHLTFLIFDDSFLTRLFIRLNIFCSNFKFYW